MSQSRLTYLISGVIVLAAVAATAIGVVQLARGGGEQTRRLPGRIAVVDGCGVLHMWSDGSDQRRLCLPGVFAAVSLSDNGKTIAWDTRNQITVAEVSRDDTSISHQRIPPLASGTDVEPGLSPDGRRVAFLHSPRNDGRYDVWVGSTSGSIDNSEQLTTTHNVSTLAWSGSGDWIAFVKGWSEVTLQGQIALIHPDGSGERALTIGDSPTWTPDGKLLAFYRGGSIWTIRPDGSGARLLIRDGHSPAWSRDGKQIAFLREDKCGKATCKEHVMIAFPNGTGARPVGPAFPRAQRVLWLRDPFE